MPYSRIPKVSHALDFRPSLHILSRRIFSSIFSHAIISLFSLKNFLRGWRILRKTGSLRNRLKVYLPTISFLSLLHAPRGTYPFIFGVANLFFFQPRVYFLYSQNLATFFSSLLQFLSLFSDTYQLVTLELSENLVFAPKILKICSLSSN